MGREEGGCEGRKRHLLFLGVLFILGLFIIFNATFGRFVYFFSFSGFSRHASGFLHWRLMGVLCSFFCAFYLGVSILFGACSHPLLSLHPENVRWA